MKFISLDIETTGLDMEQDQILEFGAIAVDTNKHPSTWKTMHVILNHPRISGNVYALSLHNRIFEFIKKNRSTRYVYDGVPEGCMCILPDELYPLFVAFCEAHFEPSNKGPYTSITVAGKNASNFDIPFLKKHFNKFNGTQYAELNDDPGNKERINFRKRVIDPAILFTDFTKDEIPADLSVCKQRAGLGHIVTHNAVEDAWDVAMLVCVHIGWDLSTFITEEFVESHWVKSEFRSVTGSMYILHQTITGGGSVSMFKNEDESHPFRQWTLHRAIGNTPFTTDVAMDYVWSQSEIAQYIPVKGEA